MSKWPMPDTIPGVVQARGGWFAVFTRQDNAGSGPWRTKAGAEAALRGDYFEAHRLDKEARDATPLAPKPEAIAGGGVATGLLDDGMCDDHGVFGCKRCLAALSRAALSETRP